MMMIFSLRDMTDRLNTFTVKKKQKKKQVLDSECAKAAAYINTHTHINQISKALCVCWSVGMKLGFL